MGCRVTTTLHDAADIQPGVSFADAYRRLLPVIGYTIANYGDNALVKLSVSAPLAYTLAAVVQEIIKDPKRTDVLTVEEVGRLRKAAQDYQPVLEAELQGIDAYYVKQQGAFSTRSLTGNAETALALPSDALPLLTDDMKADLREAGRCLVFQLPTASGFHVARATETIVKALMDSAGCPEIKESQRNWGTYAKALRDQNVDDKIVHHFEQIKDLHRNPLIHPEETLTMPEALALWSVCVSLMGSMILEIKKRKDKGAK